MTSLTTVITAHREGLLARRSLRSLLEAVTAARAAGLEIDTIVVLDRADDDTRAIFKNAAGGDWKVVETDFGDQGKARNRAVQVAGGDYIAFLDGDDLWSENWLVEGVGLCLQRPGRIIAHPEFNWFFGMNNNLFIHMDQEDAQFDIEALRFSNYWDALCIAPRRAHLDHPYGDRDLEGGFAFEDWQWNCETIEAGYVHRVAEGTIHFKRRREGSQTLHASRGKSLVRPTRLFSYSWYSRESG